MKRHPALEELSRDHHRALVVAQHLKRAEEATVHTARCDFLTYWADDGRDHFREEEEILLPTCAGFMDIEQPIFAQVLLDHVRIRHQASVITEIKNPPLRMLRELGREIEVHVRREERELFPLIEQSLRDAELRRLVALLSR